MAVALEKEKVGNHDKFQMVTSHSGLRTCIGVVLIFIFPLGFVLGSVIMAAPFFSGLSAAQL